MERRRQEAIRRAFLRLDAVALGAGAAAVFGLGLAAATAILLFRGSADGEVGPKLALLGQFLPGYRVGWPGVAVGLLEGAAAGFALGWLVASVRNAALRFVLWKAVADQRRWRRRHLLDEI
ncbi:MAG TPA: hypothetical protein VEI02_06970 [Planctomycetota bacterium]|nr:hypothetical protein [Planctomycetota bacterium]